jgi:hypothetical protein
MGIDRPAHGVRRFMTTNLLLYAQRPLVPLRPGKKHDAELWGSA